MKMTSNNCCYSEESDGFCIESNWFALFACRRLSVDLEPRVQSDVLSGRMDVHRHRHRNRQLLVACIGALNEES